MAVLNSAVPMPPARWLSRRARSVRAQLGGAIGAGAAATVLLCAQAALLAWALHAAIFEGRAVAALWPALAAYAALALGRFALGLAGRRCGFEAGRRMVAQLRADLLAQLQALGPAWLARRASGELVTRLVDGVDALEPYYARYLPQLAAAALLPLVVLAAVFPGDWVAGLVLLLTAPLVPVFMILLGKAAERASQRRWAVLTRLGAQFMDSLQGLATLRLFGAGERQRQRLAAAGEHYRRETMAVLRVAFLSSLVLEFFATVSVALVAVLVGFRLFWGTEAFSRGMFVLLLAPEFYLPLKALGALRHARMDAAAIAEEAQAIFAEPLPATAGRRARPGDRPPEIVFDDVHFAHQEGRGGLAGLSLRFEAGRTTAVVGASGAGKSTLLMALLGFVTPQRGAIRIDGVDLASLDLRAWRDRLAWVPQRPHLFVGSLRENLAIASPGSGEAELRRAARAAGLEPVIARLPQGWDTPLGEHGYGLSGGEAQRVALARAFLRDVPLLLLDEPLQQLDDATAGRVQSALDDWRRGRTVVQVAHRMAAAQDADAVVVIGQGRLLEAGRPAQLLAAGGRYAQLCAADASS